MSVKEYTGKIIQELHNNAQYLEDRQLSELVDAIIQARHIFVAGAGRSGVAIKGFANRLMHLGCSVSIVGDITNPHTGEGDLLIIGSGSGETGSLISLSEKAKKSQVKIALITMDSESTIGKLSDVCVVLPGVSPKVNNQMAGIKSIQPMGSAFEQISFLTYDGIILELMNRIKETSDMMFERHANLE